MITVEKNGGRGVCRPRYRAQRARIDDFSPYWRDLVRARDAWGGIEAFRERGIRVVPWTVNDESAMERLIELGVDGIITDRPDLLVALCRRRGIEIAP